MLVKPKAKRSWAKEFPPGNALYAGLTSAFTDINIFGKDGNAERDLYADFLDEASLILDKPALKPIAQQFRTSAKAWHDLGLALLPDDAPLLRETRQLMLQNHRLFLEQGNKSLAERVAINGRLAAIKAQIATDFPLNESEVRALHQNIRDHVLAIHNIEKEAITALQDAMS